MSRLTFGPVRISYPYLFNPRPSAIPGGQEKYSVTLLIPKSATATMAKIQEAMEITKSEYLARFSKATWVKNAKNTLHDGDGTRPSGDEFGPECKGHWVITASSKTAPLVVDQAKNAIIDQSQIYGGCFGLAVVNFYCYENSGNKGISCAIDGFMKTADGQALGNAVTVDAFDKVAADDLAQLQAMLM